MSQPVLETNLLGIPRYTTGKVRDVYDLGDRLVHHAGIEIDRGDDRLARVGEEDAGTAGVGENADVALDLGGDAIAVGAGRAQIERAADVDILVMPRISISEAVAERLDAIRPHARLLDRRDRAGRGVEQAPLRQQARDGAGAKQRGQDAGPLPGDDPGRVPVRRDRWGAGERPRTLCLAPTTRSRAA